LLYFHWAISAIYIAATRFSQTCGALFLACGYACAVLNKSLGFKYEMLVTFHAIWYVFAEICTPAWQKDLRDITFFIIEAMEEAKKE